MMCWRDSNFGSIKHILHTPHSARISVQSRSSCGHVTLIANKLLDWWIAVNMGWLYVVEHRKIFGESAAIRAAVGECTEYSEWGLWIGGYDQTSITKLKHEESKKRFQCFQLNFSIKFFSKLNQTILLLLLS